MNEGPAEAERQGDKENLVIRPKMPDLRPFMKGRQWV